MDFFAFCVLPVFNAATILDFYMVQRSDECTESLGIATIFSKLDANRVNWRVKTAEERRDKTAFTSHDCVSCFSCNRFRFKNVAVTFQ